MGLNCSTLESVQGADLVAQLEPLLSTLPEDIVAVYLFGSHARGEQRTGSDIDLAFWRRQGSRPVLTEQPYALATRLELALGREVDLVELNGSPPDLIHEVLRDGIIVLDRDPAARVRFEVAGRAHYLDMLPTLRTYRRAEQRS